MFSMCRILVVDDLADNLSLLKTFLEIEEYTVDVANSGLVAIDLVEELRSDVVILDIFLTDMIGYAIVEQIRQKPNLSGIRVVLATASSDSV